MSSSRVPRWTALLVLPLLVGALLLMHGLDARASAGGLPEASAATPAHAHHRAVPAEHDDEQCASCAVGHVTAACVAIVLAVIGLRLARRGAGFLVPALLDSVGVRLTAARELLRSAEPAWVRLAVMRC
jgi:hypothetical protein